MRIVLLSWGFIDIVIELANSLAKNHDIKLMLPKNSLEKIHIKMISNKVDFDSFSTPRVRYPSNIIMIGKLVRKIRAFNPDVIHIQGHGHPWFCFAFPFLKKYPIINSVHDVNPHTGDKMIKGNLISEVFGPISTDHFIVHSKYSKERLLEKYAVSEDMVSMVYFGGIPSYENIETKKYAVEPNTILFIGRIWKYKGLEYLIKAEPLISEVIPDVKIIIAGKGEKFDKYESMMKKKDNFIVKNRHIPFCEMITLFQKASVVVLPYTDATQSGIIPFAYQYATPVVATRVGSFSEFIEDGIEGYLVPSKDVESLSEAIISILRDEDMRLKMGINARKKFDSLFSWDIIAKKTVESYRLASRRKNEN